MNVQTLAQTYGTPVYMYDLNRIQDASEELHRMLPEASWIYYSLKANPHPEIVQKLVSLGCRAELSSLREIEVALQTGMDPALCLFTGPGKSEMELTKAIYLGITLFSVESLQELHKLASIARKLSCCIDIILRINPAYSTQGSGLTMTGVSSQFGMDESALLDDVQHMTSILEDAPEIRVKGFHIFTGSNVKSEADLLQNFKGSIDSAVRLSKALNIPIELLDLGGGFGAPYAINGKRLSLEGVKASLEQYLDVHLPNWRKASPQLIFESGRYLVAESGDLLSTVIDVKISRGKKYIVVDTGIHHLGGMSALGRIPRVHVDVIVNQRECTTPDSDRYPTYVAGPLCTPLDYYVADDNLSAVVPGDLLLIPNVGAYGLTASLIGFLSREAPVEVVYDGDEVISSSQISLIRQYERVSVN